MRRWRRAALSLLLALVLLSGCWDLRELDQLALVMAVGIDKAEAPGRFLVTIQVARPSQSKGGGGKGESGGGKPTYTASADGDTIFAAIRNLAQFTSRRIMWAHNNIIVIGEPLAREGITPVIDFFTRNQELRMRTWIVVARNAEAREVVAAQTGMESIPANSLSAIMRYASLPGETVRTDVGQVATDFMKADMNMVIAAVRLSERLVPGGSAEGGSGLQVELRGTALFDGPRLAGFVEAETGRGLLWLHGKMRNAVITVPCPGNRANMAVELRSPRTRVRSYLQQGKPVFYITAQTEGWLSEQDCPTTEMDAIALKELVEKEMTQKINSDIKAALTYLQDEVGVDAIGFGRRVHVEHPVWWRQNSSRWKELFPEVRVTVEVDARLSKMGIYTLPTQPKSPH